MASEISSLSNRSYDHLFKLIIVGDSCVGKTSILQRFHGENFLPVSVPTIGIDFRIRTISIQNKIIKLQIWDTSGQEKYDSITTSYYRGAMGVLLVYDITNRKSFESIKSRWIKHINDVNLSNMTNIQEPIPLAQLGQTTELSESLAITPFNNTREGIKIVFIGNKCDLNSKRQVNSEVAEAMAISNGFRYYETSAKENINLDHVFYEISKDIFNEKCITNDENSISLPEKSEDKKRKSYRCCQVTFTL